MLIVKGVQRKAGTFDGHSYDNFNLHCLNTQPSSPCIAGDACEIIKVKADQVLSIFGGLIKSDADWRALIDQPIEPYYDRFGRAIKISLSDIPK